MRKAVESTEGQGIEPAMQTLPITALFIFTDHGHLISDVQPSRVGLKAVEYTLPRVDSPNPFRLRLKLASRVVISLRPICHHNWCISLIAVHCSLFESESDALALCAAQLNLASQSYMGYSVIRIDHSIPFDGEGSGVDHIQRAIIIGTGDMHIPSAHAQ